jgi:hypothetical protein
MMPSEVKARIREMLADGEAAAGLPLGKGTDAERLKTIIAANSLGLQLVPPPCDARPPRRAAAQAHGQRTTVCGRAIGSWSGSPRIEFEVNLVTEVLSFGAVKDRPTLGVIEAAEQAGHLRPG